ncbi:MAG: flagellar motor protein MotB [Phycisphaerae bacterium]
MTKRIRLTSLAGMAAGVAILFAATGCCQKEKKLNQELSAALADERDINDQLRSDLAGAENQISALQNQLNAKDQSLSAQRATISDLQSKLDRPQQTPGQDWERGLTGDRVTLASDILFPSGRAKLTSAGKASLDKIVSDLKNNPDYKGQPVRVVGYTDTDPIVKTKNLWSDNLDLSLNRAAEVTRYLGSQGIDAKNIETIGMGEQFPLSSKAKSRRVEIIVVKD